LRAAEQGVTTVFSFRGFLQLVHTKPSISKSGNLAPVFAKSSATIQAR
jgi:hypothetical protein